MKAPNEDLPKTPPFIFDGSSGARASQEPASRPAPSRVSAVRGNGQPSERGMLNVAIFLISSLSMGIALSGGAWIGYGVLQNGSGNQPGLFARIAAAGLAYGVGWVVGLFGIRKLGNFILPLMIKIYAWVVMVGLSTLQIAIITKLFKQIYTPEKFFYYLVLFGAGILALIGLHLILENHNLVPFSFPLLVISLAHLYFIVFHYVFFPPEKVEYQYLWGDAIFFVITSIVGALMLAHFGMLSRIRDGIDRTFRENTDHFVPPR